MTTADLTFLIAGMFLIACAVVPAVLAAMIHETRPREES